MDANLMGTTSLQFGFQQGKFRIIALPAKDRVCMLATVVHCDPAFAVGVQVAQQG